MNEPKLHFTSVYQTAINITIWRKVHKNENYDQNNNNNNNNNNVSELGQLIIKI
jgi:hypothetical protein